MRKKEKEIEALVPEKRSSGALPNLYGTACFLAIAAHRPFNGLGFLFITQLRSTAHLVVVIWVRFCHTDSLEELPSSTSFSSPLRWLPWPLDNYNHPSTKSNGK